MPVRASAPHAESAGELVAGMAHDVKHLGEQYLELVKLELSQGITTIKRELIRVSIGVGAAAIGAVFLMLALAYAATDELGVPRWIAYGVLALAAIGGGVAALVRPQHDESHTGSTPRRDPAS